LERGVFKALEEQYLQAMTFAVCTQHPSTGEDLVVEKYEFKLTYMSEDGSVAPTLNGAPMDSKDDLKVRPFLAPFFMPLLSSPVRCLPPARQREAKKFLRSLISFAQTLDDLPEDRWYATSRPRTLQQPSFFLLQSVVLVFFTTATG